MFRWVTSVALLLACATVASGEDSTGGGKISLFTGGSGIELSAERMEFDRAKGILEANGHVTVRQAGEGLTADRLTIRTATRDVWATGNVVYSNRTSVWSGNRLYCNMGSGRIVTEGVSDFRDGPFKVRFEGGRRYDKDAVVEGSNATMTTCALDPDHWHYNVKSGSSFVHPGKMYLAEDVWINVGGIPVFYLPYWRETTDGTGLEFQPGYSSWQGAYLLSSYKYRVDDQWRARTRFDYRTLRGMAAGQDFNGVDRDGLWATEVKTYYAYDRRALEPWEEDAGMTRDKNRYRVRLSHSYYPDARSYVYARLHAMSDVDLLEDFFRSEFRVDPRPESYVLYGTFGSNYIAGVGTRFRVNNYYETVERLPEAYVDFPRSRLGDLPLYYDGHNAASFLRRTYPVDSESEDYSAVRMDSRHTLSVIKKVGVVNVVPRAGTRLTYYSETPPESVTGELAVASSPGGAAIRTLFETGVDTSFKAFRVWSQPEKGVGGLRHVLEPFANYTFVPEPNELPEGLYQFDDVDSLTKRNVVRLGVRNKLQKRYKKRPYDVVDSRVWTDGNLDAVSGEHAFNSVATDTEIRPFGWLAVDFDGEFSYRGAGVLAANTHIWTFHGGGVSTDFEHRYSADGRHVLISDLTYNPQEGYTCRYNTRLGLAEGRIEEHTLWLGRNTDCLVGTIGLGQVPAYTRSDGTEQVNEYKILFGIWIRALPGVGIFTE